MRLVQGLLRREAAALLVHLPGGPDRSAGCFSGGHLPSLLDQWSHAGNMKGRHQQTSRSTKTNTRGLPNLETNTREFSKLCGNRGGTISQRDLSLSKALCATPQLISSCKLVSTGLVSLVLRAKCHICDFPHFVSSWRPAGGHRSVQK